MNTRAEAVRTYVLRILLTFIAALAITLTLSWTILAQAGYYGTSSEPRYSDRWIPRAETLMNGGALYNDVPTTTPPLINFLLVPPVFVSGLFEHRNPWSTMSFQIYFSLFNLLTAYMLFLGSTDRKMGYKAALYFLLNPLTLGNSVLRRQDEAVLVFFWAVSLLLTIRRKHWAAGVVYGLSLLIKVSGLLMIPIAFFRTLDWRYLVLPLVVFAAVATPFLSASGSAASLLDVRQPELGHPFQLDGVSLGALWSRMRDTSGQPMLPAYSGILVIATLVVAVWIMHRPHGLIEDLLLLTATVLALAPKLHTGYLALLVLLMTPLLLQQHELIAPYFILGSLGLVADLLKFPYERFTAAFVTMVACLFNLAVVAVYVRLHPSGISGKPA